MSARFSQITETPGIGATREQLEMLATRYALACRHAGGGPVLEVACGTGIGLGMLADAGGGVVGSDIDPDNVRVARSTWNGDPRITVEQGDASGLSHPSGAFASVVCFEALYYFPDLERCLSEMIRVLKPGGTLVLCTVNAAWSGFNRSPFATEYPTPMTLSAMLLKLGCRIEVFGAFADRPRGIMSRAIGSLRRLAVRFHLIPGSMRGKQLLKSLFLGGTVPMPTRLVASTATPHPLVPLPSSTVSAPWKVFYLTAVKTP